MLVQTVENEPISTVVSRNIHARPRPIKHSRAGAWNIHPPRGQASMQALRATGIHSDHAQARGLRLRFPNERESKRPRSIYCVCATKHARRHGTPSRISVALSMVAGARVGLSDGSGQLVFIKSTEWPSSHLRRRVRRERRGDPAPVPVYNLLDAWRSRRLFRRPQRRPRASVV